MLLVLQPESAVVQLPRVLQEQRPPAKLQRRDDLSLRVLPDVRVLWRLEAVRLRGQLEVCSQWRGREAARRYWLPVWEEERYGEVQLLSPATVWRLSMRAVLPRRAEDQRLQVRKMEARLPLAWDAVGRI